MSKNITIDGVSLLYTITRSTKKKLYIRVKDGIVKVSATKRTTVKEIEDLLKLHIEFIKKQLAASVKEKIIHVNGIAYIPRFFISNKQKVEIIDDEIHIYSKVNEEEQFKKVLYDFYKKEVEKELVKIINDAMFDFRELNFPTISVRYMKSMFGNYHRVKHHIKLSSVLAKYDYKYIKFVLYHELCHIKEFNHSSKFFTLYESKYEGAKEVRKNFKKIKYNDYL